MYRANLERKGSITRPSPLLLQKTLRFVLFCLKAFETSDFDPKTNST